MCIRDRSHACLKVIFLERRPSEPKRAKRQARAIEMTVSSTVMMLPAAMYQNHCFMTSKLMRLPPDASPADLNVQEYLSTTLLLMASYTWSGAPFLLTREILKVNSPLANLGSFQSICNVGLAGAR